MPPVKKIKSKPAPQAKVTVEEEVSTPVISGQLKKKLKSLEKRQKHKRGVVFVKHLPHGFFEEQLRSYFEQFGAVTRLRLARSKNTGGTKGYAFVEFEYPEVAEVAAETMDNYLMFNKVVKAAYIPPEKQLYDFFKTSVRKVKNKAGKAIYVSSKTAQANRNLKKFNNWTDEAYQRRTEAKQNRIKKLNKKYAYLGIDFNAIVIGSKKADETNKNNAAKAEAAKTGKRKVKSSEEINKKPKKSLDLEDLLGNTLNDDTDDEDFVIESNDDDDNDVKEEKTRNKKTKATSDNKKKSNESISLEDLLGETLNEDSDDSEYELNNEVDADEDENESEDEESSDDENNKNKTKKSKVITKKEKKIRNVKLDRLEELIKHKKNAGGIQKSSKNFSKKIGKPKNAMQAALCKQMAQPLPSLNKIKQKKQKTK